MPGPVVKGTKALTEAESFQLPSPRVREKCGQSTLSKAGVAAPQRARWKTAKTRPCDLSQRKCKWLKTVSKL